MTVTELRVATKMAQRCCLNCANLLVCPDILTYKCRKHETGQVDKLALSTRYIEITEQIVGLIEQLRMVESAMTIAEKKALIPIDEASISLESEQKPALSKRNKEIVKLIEQGKGIKDIAEELKIKPETVGVELEYLLKAGSIKAKPT